MVFASLNTVRCRILLHLVDVAPFDNSTLPAAKAIISELEQFSASLAERDRWLILNKVTYYRKISKKKVQRVIDALDWQGPVYKISAIAAMGTEPLCQNIMNFIEERALQESEDAAVAEQEYALRARMEEEARLRMRQIAEERRARREAKKAGHDDDDDDDFDDDDYDVEVFYAP